jgi:hypothetical protein
MSTTTYNDPALAGTATRRDAHELLGQVMGLVAVTVGFTALGAGRRRHRRVRRRTRRLRLRHEP